MSDLNHYLQEGVGAASNARAQTNFSNWADSWKNFATQYALSSMEFDRNKEMWNLMNQYNSPQAQMQRFSEAGLNPNLIYQQGTPGNASSPVQYKAPNVNLTPGKDKNDIWMTRLQGMSALLGSVNDIASNISKLYSNSLNIGLQKNALQQSNFDVALLNHYFDYDPSGNVASAFHYGDLGNMLNPMSPDFDPLAYITFQKHGQLPQFWNNYLTSDVQRELSGFRSAYQKYYNENLLPKLNQFYEGKNSLQDMEVEFQKYQNEVRTMIPAPLKGILDPLFSYLGPLFKFIFKQTNVSR